MRKIARTDGNQTEIVLSLREQGYEVVITAQLGGGIPDIVVSKRGTNCNLWVEVKQIKNKRGDAADLTEAEVDFFAEWPGPCIVATTSQDVTDWFNNSISRVEGGALVRDGHTRDCEKLNIRKPLKRKDKVE